MKAEPCIEYLGWRNVQQLCKQLQETCLPLISTLVAWMVKHIRNNVNTDDNCIPRASQSPPFARTVIKQSPNRKPTPLRSHRHVYLSNHRRALTGSTRVPGTFSYHTHPHPNRTYKRYKPVSAIQNFINPPRRNQQTQHLLPSVPRITRFGGHQIDFSCFERTQ